MNTSLRLLFHGEKKEMSTPEARRADRKKNPEKHRAADKRFRERHKERLNAQDRAYYWANRESELARKKDYCREYHKRNKARLSVIRRNTRYGIAEGWFETQLQKQGDKCSICKRDFIKTPHLDHDHFCCPSIKSCGECVRGLLCDDCNLGLGRFKDSIEVLQNAIKYLEGYQCASPQQSM